eukprot:259582-Amphidinium_carterae.1
MGKNEEKMEKKGNLGPKKHFSATEEHPRGTLTISMHGQQAARNPSVCTNPRRASSAMFSFVYELSSEHAQQAEMSKESDCTESDSVCRQYRQLLKPLSQPAQPDDKQLLITLAQD